MFIIFLHSTFFLSLLSFWPEAFLVWPSKTPLSSVATSLDSGDKVCVFMRAARFVVHYTCAIPLRATTSKHSDLHHKKYRRVQKENGSKLSIQ